MTSSPVMVRISATETARRMPVSGVRQRGRPEQVPDPVPATEAVRLTRSRARPGRRRRRRAAPGRAPARTTRTRRAAASRHAGAVEDHRQRDQGHRRDRAQELDGRRGRRAQQRHRADDDTHDDPGGDRDPEAGHPGAQSDCKRVPELRPIELFDQRRADLDSSVARSRRTRPRGGERPRARGEPEQSDHAQQRSAAPVEGVPAAVFHVAESVRRRAHAGGASASDA